MIPETEAIAEDSGDASPGGDGSGADPDAGDSMADGGPEGSSGEGGGCGPDGSVDGDAVDGDSGVADPGDGDRGETDSGDGDFDVSEAGGHGSVDFPSGADGQGDGVCSAGGFVFLSLPPVSPVPRVNQPPLLGSYMTNLFTTRGAGSTTTTFEERYPAHRSPLISGLPFDGTGSSSGLPHAQRTRGTPRSSTSTAVPA